VRGAAVVAAPGSDAWTDGGSIGHKCGLVRRARAVFAAAGGILVFVDRVGGAFFYHDFFRDGIGRIGCDGKALIVVALVTGSVVDVVPGIVVGGLGAADRSTVRGVVAENEIQPVAFRSDCEGFVNFAGAGDASENTDFRWQDAF